MFQYAVDRLSPLFPLDRILVVTRAEHTPLLREQAPGLPEGNFIVEPVGRGTAPAIGLAAVHLSGIDPKAVMAVLTADHYIGDVASFQEVLRAADKVAGKGHLVTLGITPSVPSTGYGYIEHGDSLGSVEGQPVYRVRQFIEKPDLSTAQQMVESKAFSWNSGMFIWRVDRILAEFQRQMPELSDHLSALAADFGSAAYGATLARIWPSVTKQTIDYGVMEGAQDIVVIPADIGWTDVGSWGSLFSLLPADEDGNVWVGPHVGINTENTLAFGEKRLIATIGVKDMIIIETADAVLVCPREREQEVKEMVEHLKESGYDLWL
jgi:mannose-1-phosphate guanylyltransferase